MDKEALLKNIDDDVDDDLARVAKKIGPDAIDVLVEELSGSKIHIPDARCFWDRIKRIIRDKKIKREFNGKNLKEIRQKYNLRTSQVYSIARKRKKKYD